MKNNLNGSNKELKIEVLAETLHRLSGDLDENFKIIERELGIRVHRTASGLVLIGPDNHVALAFDLLKQLGALVEKGEEIFAGDIERSIKLLSENQNYKLSDLFRDQLRISGRRKSIVPKTPNQNAYLEAIRTHDMVFGVGPAGTGKTYLAMAMAVSMLLRKEVRRIVLCRPAVESGEKLGFLPGDLAEKVNPYLRPLYDALHDLVDIERSQEFIEKGIIEVAPLAFMRGRTLANSFVILDEAQNTTVEQMKMFLTRIGFGSRCVVTGDITQIDLPRSFKSGLIDALEVCSNVEGLKILTFAKEDIIRHPLVSKIVDAYERRG